MWHQKFPFSAVHLVGKMWMQSQQSGVPLLAAHLLSSCWLLALAGWYLVASFPYVLLWATVGACFKFILLLLTGKKKIFSIFGCVCPKVLLIWWSKLGDLLKPLVQKWEAQRSVSMVWNTLCCAPQHQSWDSSVPQAVGMVLADHGIQWEKKRFRKEQPDMYEAELSASLGWLY